MYRDIVHTSRYLQENRLRDAEPAQRRQWLRPRIWVGTFLMHLGERFLTGLETPVGTRA
jgi:hypothetical protein